MPVIELEGLSVRLGGRAVLKELQATLSGSCVGLLGPNGAGKTTLIHSLLGFHPLAEGTASILGHHVEHQSKALRSLIGYMPERDSFIAGMTGVRFVRLMAELSGLPSRAALERTHEALFYVGLGEARYRNIETYSLGMKQLVKLAQAVVHGPKLIFLDEPTNGLDPPARRKMLDLIRDIRDSGRASIVLSSHLLRDVDECCDEALVLKDGRIARYCNLAEERRAHRKFLDLEVVGDRESFTAELERRGVDCALDGQRRLKVVLPESADVTQLFEIAAAQDLEIRRLHSKRDSLEDIFLEAMGEV
jgi:ABC-2 type transport system ATP-binding protein